jgi:hypothetical protein
LKNPKSIEKNRQLDGDWCLPYALHRNYCTSAEICQSQKSVVCAEGTSYDTWHLVYGRSIQIILPYDGGNDDTNPRKKLIFITEALLIEPP